MAVTQVQFLLSVVSSLLPCQLLPVQACHSEVIRMIDLAQVLRLPDATRTRTSHVLGDSATTKTAGEAELSQVSQGSFPASIKGRPVMGFSKWSFPG